MKTNEQATDSVSNNTYNLS